jgi:integrase
VSGRLGHSSIGITLDTYRQSIPALDEEAADAIDDALRSAKE